MKYRPNKSTAQINELQGGFIDGHLPSALVCSLKNGRTMSYEFQTAHDATVFRQSHVNVPHLPKEVLRVFS